MANILLDAANWQDTSSFAQPPSWWTGRTYEWIGNVGTGLYYYGATMQYEGTVNAGDTIAGSIHSTSADNTEFGITVNGTHVATESLATNQTSPFSFTLSASDVVVVTLGVGNYLYSQDAVLTPTAAPIVKTPDMVRLRWTDDGGHNWSNFMSSAMGATGQTANRVIFRRLGSTRESTGLDRVFEISSDAYIQTCLVGASFIDG